MTAEDEQGPEPVLEPSQESDAEAEAEAEDELGPADRLALGLSRTEETELITQSRGVSEDSALHAFIPLTENYRAFLFHHILYHALPHADTFAPVERVWEWLVGFAHKIEVEVALLAWFGLRGDPAVVSSLPAEAFRLLTERGFGVFLCEIAHQVLKSAGLDMSGAVPWIAPWPTTAAMGGVLLLWSDILADERLTQFARAYFACRAAGELRKFPVREAVEAYLSLLRQRLDPSFVPGTALMQGLIDLTPMQQHCVVMSGFFGLPPDEISAILGTQPTLVSDAISSGRTDLLNGLPWDEIQAWLQAHPAARSTDPTVYL